MSLYHHQQFVRIARAITNTVHRTLCHIKILLTVYTVIIIIIRANRNIQFTFSNYINMTHRMFVNTYIIEIEQYITFYMYIYEHRNKFGYYYFTKCIQIFDLILIDNC